MPSFGVASNVIVSPEYFGTVGHVAIALDSPPNPYDPSGPDPYPTRLMFCILSPILSIYEYNMNLDIYCYLSIFAAETLIQSL
jgi:hypothetical protein